MSRDLNELTRQTREMALLLIQRARERGINIIITSTYRSFIEQDRLYAQGRTRPGRIITNAKGGMSYHNVRRAIDIGVMKGKKVSYTCVEDYRTCGRIGKDIGLTWGGDFKRLRDLPHFQYDYCEDCKRRHTSATAFFETGECKVSGKIRNTRPGKR
ncbi:MAG: Peptidoglycan L-alanyl-D-glutamate endopeptidase CwlK [candidate division WS2 bacterium]|nr:Peptidoglycan L-alanyl-D-glutamate endopeptidase CwlK [Candidatus Lithacetigena glycinireducens]